MFHNSSSNTCSTSRSEIQMSCNSMQQGSNFNRQLLSQQHLELGHGPADSVLFYQPMGYDAELDMLLADAGYNVKSADLAHVAQRLEQLESLCAAHDAGLISHLSSEAVHRNPSDMAGWVESMIEEVLAPPGSDGDSSAVVDGIFQQQSPLYGPVDDNFGGLMDYCSMDQRSTAQQFDNRAPYASSMPKQSLSMEDMVQPPIEGCNPSISQLIKDAIGHHGVSAAASGTTYANKQRSSNMMIVNGDVGGYQQYKGVEDQASSNQRGNFYENQTQEMAFSSGFSGGIDVQGPHGLPKSNSMPSLHQQPQLPAMAIQAIPTFQHQKTHLQHIQVQRHEHHDLKPSSSQSSNGRVSSQESQHGPQLQEQQQVEARPQQVKVKSVSSPSTMSSSSPTVPIQEHSRASKKEAAYVHAADELPHGQRHTAQQSAAYVDANDDGGQEPGIRLVHLLMACAEAIQNSELAAAVDMVREIKRLASSSSGAMAKVATQFVEALARRIYGANVEDWASLSLADPWSELLYSNFYEACPYLKFAHFTANQAILEAFEGHKFVHVIDFNLMQGLQWPPLIQALALRPGGPPHLRMTGIGPPQPDNKDVLQEIGMKLAQLAGSVNVEFSFRGVVATKLDDVKPWMLEVKQGEAVAVNSILQLHRLLHGTNPKSGLAPIDEVLTSIKSLSPKIVTIVEQEANHNSPIFLERFVEALHYYCTMFDSLEACFLHPQCSEMACTEMYMGREIVNIVACEGMARIERHEPLSQWRRRMLNAGFHPLHLGSNAFKQASMLLKLFSGEGYTVEENHGCLTLGWHSRPLIAASVWQCG